MKKRIIKLKDAHDDVALRLKVLIEMLDKKRTIDIREYRKKVVAARAKSLQRKSSK